MKRGPDVEAMTHHIAKRIMAARKERGMSQLLLGKALDVTFQQIQKYEKGDNRVSSGSMILISRALAKPVAWFFDGFDAKGDGTDKLADFFSLPYAGELAKAYAGLTNQQRDIVRRVAEGLAGMAPQ